MKLKLFCFLFIVYQNTNLTNQNLSTRQVKSKNSTNVQFDQTISDTGFQNQTSINRNLTNYDNRYELFPGQSYNSDGFNPFQFLLCPDQNENENEDEDENKTQPTPSEGKSIIHIQKTDFINADHDDYEHNILTHQEHSLTPDEQNHSLLIHHNIKDKGQKENHVSDENLVNLDYQNHLLPINTQGERDEPFLKFKHQNQNDQAVQVKVQHYINAQDSDENDHHVLINHTIEDNEDETSHNLNIQHAINPQTLPFELDSEETSSEEPDEHQYLNMKDNDHNTHEILITKSSKETDDKVTHKVKVHHVVTPPEEHLERIYGKKENPMQQHLSDPDQPNQNILGTPNIVPNIIKPLKSNRLPLNILNKTNQGQPDINQMLQNLIQNLLNSSQNNPSDQNQNNVSNVLLILNLISLIQNNQKEKQSSQQDQNSQNNNLVPLLQNILDELRHQKHKKSKDPDSVSTELDNINQSYQFKNHPDLASTPKDHPIKVIELIYKLIDSLPPQYKNAISLPSDQHDISEDSSFDDDMHDRLQTDDSLFHSSESDHSINDHSHHDDQPKQQKDDLTQTKPFDHLQDIKINEIIPDEESDQHQNDQNQQQLTEKSPEIQNLINQIMLNNPQMGPQTINNIIQHINNPDNNGKPLDVQLPEHKHENEDFEDSISDHSDEENQDNTEIQNQHQEENSKENKLDNLEKDDKTFLGLDKPEQNNYQDIKNHEISTTSSESSDKLKENPKEQSSNQKDQIQQLPQTQPQGNIQQQNQKNDLTSEDISESLSKLDDQKDKKQNEQNLPLTQPEVDQNHSQSQEKSDHLKPQKNNIEDISESLEEIQTQLNQIKNEKDKINSPSKDGDSKQQPPINITEQNIQQNFTTENNFHSDKTDEQPELKPDPNQQPQLSQEDNLQVIEENLSQEQPNKDENQQLKDQEVQTLPLTTPENDQVQQQIKLDNPEHQIQPDDDQIERDSDGNPIINNTTNISNQIILQKDQQYPDLNDQNSKLKPEQNDDSEDNNLTDDSEGDDQLITEKHSNQNPENDYDQIQKGGPLSDQQLDQSQDDLSKQPINIIHVEDNSQNNTTNQMILPDDQKQEPPIDKNQSEILEEDLLDTEIDKTHHQTTPIDDHKDQKQPEDLKQSDNDPNQLIDNVPEDQDDKKDVPVQTDPLQDNLVPDQNISNINVQNPDKKVDNFNININKNKENHIHLPLQTPKTQHHIVINLHVKEDPQKVFVDKDFVEDDDCEDEKCRDEIKKALEKILQLPENKPIIQNLQINILLKLQICQKIFINFFKLFKTHI